MQGKHHLPLAALLLSASVLAQPASLQPKTENGVRYVCGGVGQDESTYLKEEAQKGGQLLTFSARDGSYVANVHVEIDDAQGKALLQTECDGPMMLVNLPDKGSYRVKAEYRGDSQTRTLAADKPGGRAVFVWDAKEGGTQATGNGR
jgi:hypothetical protein